MADDTVPLASLPDWLVAPNYSPDTFQGRLYAYGDPGDEIKDSRGGPTPYDRMKAGTQMTSAIWRMIFGFDPFPSRDLFQTPFHRSAEQRRGHLSDDAGYYDILYPPKNSGRLPLSDIMQQ